MRLLLAAGLAAVVLAACAATVDPDRLMVTLDCTGRVPITGSNIARREECVVSSAQTREEAQRQAERLQHEQQRAELPRPIGGRFSP